MVSYIIVNLWMQKERYSGLKEYCDLIKEVCNGKPGVELLGIYRPLNENWNWAYIIRIDDLYTWRQIDNEINERYFEIRENITHSMARIYEARGETPKPENIDAMNYFLEEMEMWEGIDVGLEEWYNMEVKVFDKAEGIWFMGQYAPFNEGYNWTHFMMFDTMKRLRPLQMMCYNAYGRQERVLCSESRLYEKYEPD